MNAGDLARQWRAVDPDAGTRAEIDELLAGPSEVLADRFRGRLAFGTAGLRGPLGAGPKRMNRVIVRSVAAAIAATVTAAAGESARVVIGYDARHRSDVFALDSARVFAARGVAVTLLPRSRPTPVLAFAVRHLGAAAGVMVTASHNPPADNGYKVYWDDGAQIVPPIDAQIEARIDTVGLLGDDDLVAENHHDITVDDGSIHRAYLAMAAATVEPEGPRSLRTVYTALHGVGADTMVAALTAAGFDAPVPVGDQVEPDPDFPTVAFPNPEEPGALDSALSVAEQKGADLVIANDPDADRLALAVPTADGWRQLTGNETGCLLADHLLSRGSGPDRLVTTTVVSSRLLQRIAAAHGVHFAETLTGFKWIVRPAFDHPEWRFVFGYEEALGYACDPTVADKDGITAALVACELAAAEKARGRTLIDRLDDLARLHGLHRSAARALRFGGDSPGEQMATAMADLRARPPESVAGRVVSEFSDLLGPDTGWVPTDALVFGLGSTDRLVVRPSGTEPKLKLYAESMVADPGEDLRAAEAAVDASLAELLEQAPAELGLSS